MPNSFDHQLMYRKFMKLDKRTKGLKLLLREISRLEPSEQRNKLEARYERRKRGAAQLQRELELEARKTGRRIGCANFSLAHLRTRVLTCHRFANLVG